jgi:hypothetical protein
MPTFRAAFKMCKGVKGAPLVIFNATTLSESNNQESKEAKKQRSKEAKKQRSKEAISFVFSYIII